MKTSVLVHNIRSLHNVGSIFRTADAAGVAHLYLSGYTPTPPRKEITKVSVGAEDFVSWSYDESPEAIIAAAKQKGTTIIALEQADESIDCKQIINEIHSDEVLLILGEEVEGMTDDLLQAADLTMEIPMKGQKESLNVSVAFGIAIYQLI